MYSLGNTTRGHRCLSEYSYSKIAHLSGVPQPLLILSSIPSSDMILLEPRDGVKSLFSLEIYCKYMREDESNFASTLGTAPEILFYSTTSQLLASVNLLQFLHSNFAFDEILQANIFIRQKCHSVSTKLLYNDSADSSFKLQEG